MSITFRKRPNHTISAPMRDEEPHLDLKALDEQQAREAIEDDIPVLMPSATTDTDDTATRTKAPSAPLPDPSPVDAPSPIARSPEPRALHIPKPEHLRPAQAPAFSAASTPAPSAAEPIPTTTPSTGHEAPRQETGDHPKFEDYAPFLNAAAASSRHAKPELYVWTDDDTDAFSRNVQRDFTLNRIQPTAGRPEFDSSLFRAPSRPDALATSTQPVQPAADPSAAMQAEIDALVTELLDESHAYLKRRFLEEIPEIIAKHQRIR